MSEPRILILGVGNILLGDEGAGVMTVKLLQARYHFDDQVELVDGGTAGLELLACLDDKEHLIIIDAIMGTEAPGTVKKLVLDDDPPAFFQHRISPHQLGLSQMLSCAAMTDNLPARISLYGIIPASLETGLTLTATVAAAVEDIVARIIDDLKKLGVTIHHRQDLVPA